MDQPIQTLQPEIQPQKPMSKTWQIVTLTVVGVLVVGGVAAGSYYLWQKSDVNKNQTTCTMEAKRCEDGSYVGRTGPNCEFAECPSEALCEGGACPSVSASPSTAADETTDWQTYKNEQYGFEVKYPAMGWRVKINEGGVISIIKNEENDESRLGITIEDPQTKWHTTINNLDDVRINLTKLDSGSSIEFIEIARLGDESAVKYRSELSGFWSEKYLLWHDNKLYKLRYEIDPTTKVIFTPLINQILSTFNFTDDPTVGWQTYKNEQYGYEVKYPSPPGFQPYNNIQDHKFFLDNNVSSIRTNYSHGIGFCEADDAQSDCIDGPTYLILIKPFEYKNLEDMLKAEKDAYGLPFIKNYSSEVKSIIIGGVQGLSALTHTEIGGGISKYIIRNGYLYEFIDGGSEGKFRDKFDQILSTFKFTK